MIYLCNTFSVHALPFMHVGSSRDVRIERISAHKAGRILRSNAFRSFFGHPDTARHLGRYLHVTVPVCRGSMELSRGDILIVAAITGKRKLEAGLKKCPGWRFFLIELRS